MCMLCAHASDKGDKKKLQKNKHLNMIVEMLAGE